jgi:hypothetical protein
MATSLWEGCSLEQALVLVIVTAIGHGHEHEHEQDYEQNVDPPFKTPQN